MIYQSFEKLCGQKTSCSSTHGFRYSDSDEHTTVYRARNTRENTHEKREVNTDSERSTKGAQKRSGTISLSESYRLPLPASGGCRGGAVSGDGRLRGMIARLADLHGRHGGGGGPLGQSRARAGGAARVAARHDISHNRRPCYGGAVRWRHCSGLGERRRPLSVRAESDLQRRVGARHGTCHPRKE